MKINVLLSPLNAEELYFTEKVCVVVDVLRATSVISTALQNEAKEIIPVSTIEFAMKVSGDSFGGHRILAGERNTKKIEGFSLGNSPTEYIPENISGKSIILYTTNGTKALVKAKFSSKLLTCSFLNLSAVKNYLISLNQDFEILCAGDNGRFSLEDTVCAGRLVAEIAAEIEDVELTDSARSSAALHKTFGKKISKMLAETEHGKKLVENGFESDIEECSKLSTQDVIPMFKDGVIKKLNLDTSEDSNG